MDRVALNLKYSLHLNTLKAESVLIHFEGLGVALALAGKGLEVLDRFQKDRAEEGLATSNSTEDSDTASLGSLLRWSRTTLE